MNKLQGILDEMRKGSIFYFEWNNGGHNKMKPSTNAEEIFRNMKFQYSRCTTMLYEKDYSKAGLYVYIIMGYKGVITNDFDNDCITKYEAIDLLEVLKCYLTSISKILEESEVN